MGGDLPLKEMFLMMKELRNTLAEVKNKNDLQEVLARFVSAQLEGKISLAEYGQAVEAIKARGVELEDDDKAPERVESPRAGVAAEKAEKAFGVGVFATSLVATLPGAIVAGVKASNSINKEEISCLASDIRADIHGLKEKFNGLFSKK